MPPQAYDLGGRNRFRTCRVRSRSHGRRYDLIIDIAGDPALSRLRRALTPAGPPPSSAARKAAT
jgi:hypothetical protein